MVAPVDSLASMHGQLAVYSLLIITIIIITEMAVFNVAGYLIEERRRWPVITASPRGQHFSDEKTVPVATGWTKNPSGYSAPVGAQTDDLPPP